MISSAIWKEHERVNFSKTTIIARVRKTSKGNSVQITVLLFFALCYLEIALLSANQVREIFSFTLLVHKSFSVV